MLLAGADVNISARNFGSNQAYERSTVQVSRVSDVLLVNSNKLMTQDMKYGGTPLHWSSSREVIEPLIEKGTNVNALNFDGRSALHIMVSRNRLDCVVALLSHEAEVDIKDKDGNTPLHVAVEKKFVPIVQCLVVFGSDINMLNKDGKSPRHMVGKDASGSSEDMILYILHSVGAKRCPEKNTKCPVGCNAKGDYNGIPPAKPDGPESREHITEVLASTSKAQRKSITTPPNAKPKEIRDSPIDNSGANNLIDLTIEQKEHSVMDTLLAMFTSKVVKTEPAPAINSPEKEKSVEIDNSDVNMSDSMESKVSMNPNAGRGRLLSLDGGGIRGLVLAQMLLEIEKMAQTPISHMFDWIAGTSTGGILALALGCGKTMKQCMCLYLRLKEQAFIGSRPYPSENLENVLKENLGPFTVMSDIEYPRIMVTAVMADRKPVDLHLFRNYQSASDLLGIVSSTGKLI